MAPWIPFMLLPLYFGGLAVLMVWFAPRMRPVNPTTPAKVAADEATSDAPTPKRDIPEATPSKRVAQRASLFAPRARPKRSTTSLGVIL